MHPSDKIYIAGHRGMAGSALMRRFHKAGYGNIVVRPSDSLDLRDPHAVSRFFDQERPRYVLLAAAQVGGIIANSTMKADFIYNNLMIQNNIIHGSYRAGVEKLLFLGSSCIYPKMAPQPIKEEYLMTGPLEPTNDAYAIAKIAGIKMCQAYREQYNCNFISVMPTNLYGSNDNYHPSNSHVLPALILRFHHAKEAGDEAVTIWGTGTPRREFLHADDLADACYHLMLTYDSPDPVNIGAGEDITIAELGELIAKITGFEGSIHYDLTKPDGTPRKLLDVSRLSSLGWKQTIPLETGIRLAYADFLSKHPARQERKTAELLLS